MTDAEELARVMEMEKRVTEMQKECLQIHSVRCATHTLELAIKDTIDVNQNRIMPESCQIYINMVRNVIDVVRYVRTTKMRIQIEMNELLMPIPFVDVRWSTVSTMVSDIQGTRMDQMKKIII